MKLWRDRWIHTAYKYTKRKRMMLYLWQTSPVIKPNTWPELKSWPDLPASTFGVPSGSVVGTFVTEPVVPLQGRQQSHALCLSVWQPSTGAGEWKNKKNSVLVRDIDSGRVDINMRSNPGGGAQRAVRRPWVFGSFGKPWEMLEESYLVSQNLKLINPFQ